MAHDTDIVKRIRSGDRNAFSELYLECHKRLVEFAYVYTRSTATAQDVVQDVFLQLWEQRESWTVRQGAKVYLFGAVRNRAISALRREDTAERFEGKLALEQDAATSVPESSDDRVAALSAAIQMLPERVRTMIALRWQQELTYAEIAAVVGGTEESVRKQLTRAIAQLHTRLTPPNSG